MTMPPSATIVICARNAAGTVGRAVRSASTHHSRILLVDDLSTDDTVARAREAAEIDVISPPRHGPMGWTRQHAVNAVETPYLVWLDADDEFLPGRVAALVEALERSGADLAADAVQLVDGMTGKSRGLAGIPAFVRRAPVRLFERMYLPGPGVVAVRTAVAQRVGYDGALHGCEDVDFLLRAIDEGARLACLDEAGYRLYAYPRSLSRDRVRQRLMYRRALAKHSYERIARHYRAAGLSDVVCAWALVSVAMFREDYAAARLFADDAEQAGALCGGGIEPDGPSRHLPAWRVAFSRGTAALMLGCLDDAARFLEQACGLEDHVEAWNNFGVACARAGAPERAAGLFERALARCPGYADARENRLALFPTHVTTHPFRVDVARQDYAPEECVTPSCRSDAIAR